MPVYTERPLCDAIIIAPTEARIRRCNRTAQAGSTLCEKRRGTEAWQATLHKVLVPNWPDLIRVAPVKRAAPTEEKRPAPTLKVKRPMKVGAPQPQPVPTQLTQPPRSQPRPMPAAPSLRPATKLQPLPPPQPQQPAPPAPTPKPAQTYRDRLASFVGSKG